MQNPNLEITILFGSPHQIRRIVWQ